MSRRTPPTSKCDSDKSSNNLVTSSSGFVNSSVAQSSNSCTAGNPGSPRLTLRLPQMPRTPDKNLQKSGDGKPSGNGDDPYEFHCARDDNRKDGDGNAAGIEQDKSKLENASSVNRNDENKGEKRARDEEEDEARRKRKKEENAAKDAQIVKVSVTRTIARPVLDKAIKSCARLAQAVHSVGSVGVQPQTSVCGVAGQNPSSPPAISSGIMQQNISQSTDTMAHPSLPGSPHSAAREDGGDSPTLPKVPPLKIVLAPSKDVASEQEPSTQQGGKQGPGRQLPYVVNSNNAEGKEEGSEGSYQQCAAKEEAVSASITTGSNSTSTTQALTTTVVSSHAPGVVVSTISHGLMGNVTNSVNLMSPIDKLAVPTRLTRSQRGGNAGSSSEEPPAAVKTEAKQEESTSSSTGHLEVVHPRKRKIKIKVESDPEPPPPQSNETFTTNNCYEMFLKIRRQVERRRRLLFPVQPKPPQGFKDYLLNRCSYALQGNSNSQLTVPTIAAPASLAPSLKDLFNDQEKERYKLRLQHQIEREKLVLSVEQEILRVHGRAARALANQVLPFSVCTILKDEEVYNVISAEQEEKDRNARSRYNGRLFLSWLQDVDDKWEKIKENMVLRHHNESESLHAVQKMDWTWKLKELGLVEPNSKPSIEEIHVPMVQVSDFDLLPA